MPKDQRVNSLSINRARASPYPCSLRDTGSKAESSLPNVGDEKEWEEARCPICMEHPHNAVLLLCSSLEKGCRPYICDTSYRHSNCLDQFCKSSAAEQSIPIPVANTTSGTAFHRGRKYAQFRSLGGKQLVCPLCRGQIEGCVVVESARAVMDSKPRSCSLETCDFTGTYIELRKHARNEHPSFRPSVADPRRESEWRRLQVQRDFGDTLSAYQTQFGDDLGEADILTDFPLDGGVFDVLDGVHSQAEDEWSDDNDFTMDFEVEFSFSFLGDAGYDSMGWLDPVREFIVARPIETRSRRSTATSNYSREGLDADTERIIIASPPETRSRRSTATSNYYSEGLDAADSQRTIASPSPPEARSRRSLPTSNFHREGERFTARQPETRSRRSLATSNFYRQGSDADSRTIASPPGPRSRRSLATSTSYRDGSSSRRSTDRLLDSRSRNYHSDGFASRQSTDRSSRRRNSSRSRSQRWHR
ncbi:PREDICTED: uncharacterized protein LOC109179705 [Ipomoea nil]|uniref:uncharacterized protein LOC109179705 n=1 Tax=Ipomoea nil TaxID=35883 RepID=UPI000901E964|nr:PREDICTED: uncharacterized protein LOC109179705 [Ipomoea nil]